MDTNKEDATKEPTTTTYSSADAPPEEGPVEFSPSIPPIFSTSNDPAPLLTVPSLSFFSGPSAAAPSVPKKRSSGAKKSLKEEVLKSLRAVSLSPVTTKAAPWPVQALLGELSAGVIAMILYKFTTTIEASLNRQILSDKFSSTKYLLPKFQRSPPPQPTALQMDRRKRSPSIPPIFSTSDDLTPLQPATSVLLTSAITVFLFRSLRRHAKHAAKEKRFRSSGAKKSLKEEAVESLRAVSLSPVTAKAVP
ncbi:DUF3082 domain-containing [Olea europaea subsp. europaea]|uniref:DUF3082 domain-containing n=1 Tax=Olea europaea subsp. europaea TaxID=158383 RepID=A0A8S0PDA7_OLEEU|nr:DUF3082 domain-containing [Olea europaea subsp. europaea]